MFNFDKDDPRTEEEQYTSYIASLPKHHPDRIRQEAEAMPWKETARFDLAQYVESIHALKKRGYSYAEIAVWLIERAGAKNINRGHVYRTYQQWLADRQHEYDSDLRSGLIQESNSLGISEEEAERRAEVADNEASRTAKTKKTSISGEDRPTKAPTGEHNQNLL